MKIGPGKAMRAALALGCASLATHDDQVMADNALAGFYVNTDAGLNLTSDLVATPVSISLRPGVRGDISVGHAWKLAGELFGGVELDAGLLYNSLDTANSQGQSVAAKGSLMDVPLLGHGVLRWHFRSHWLAYAGAGAGGAISSLRLNAGGTNYGLSGTETDFAWQAMAGLRYEFGSSQLGLGYEYFSFRRSGLQTVGNNSIVASYTFCF